MADNFSGLPEFFAVQDVALNAKTGGGTIADANELDLLATGALAMLDDKNNLLTEQLFIIVQ